MSESKCCLCSCDFSIINFPRMMPSCEHSSCTNCLKNNILKNKNMFVVCGTCNNREEIPQLDLEYFPKNIALIKAIKQKNDQIQPPRSRQKSKHKKQQFSSQKRKEKTSSPKSGSKKRLQEVYEMCQIHSKQKQIICINDFIKLCPMCAVFGQHKNHKLKAITEIQKNIQETSLQFYELKNKKNKADSIIKNQTFKLELVQKINIRKAQLTKNIKDQFVTIFQAVQHAQKKAYDDLLKRFKEIYDKINNLVKQQNQSEKDYNQWANDFQSNLKKSLSEPLLQNKTKYFFNGPLDSLSQGQAYLHNIQECLNQKRKRLQSYPNSLILQKSQNLIKDIYNHIVLKIEETFFNSFQYINDNSPNNSTQKNNFQNMSEHQITQNDYNKKPIKVQFSSSQSFLSPMNKKIDHPLSPKKKSIPKARVKSKPKQSTAKKQEKQEMQSTTQRIVQIFCSDEGLETLDLSSFYLNDAQILQILYYVCQKKQIKCLKLSKNKLTNDGFHKCLDYLRNTTNWNISFNNLSQQALNYLIRQRQKTPNLRVINISNNKVNERKAKSYIQQLKKIGIIVTL